MTFLSLAGLVVVAWLLLCIVVKSDAEMVVDGLAYDRDCVLVKKREHLVAITCTRVHAFRRGDRITLVD